MLRILIRAWSDYWMIKLHLNWEKWATFRNILFVSGKGWRNIAGKLVAASRQTLFRIRCKQEQLVEVTKDLVLFIESDNCLLTVSGQMIIQSEDVPGFSPNMEYIWNSIATAMFGVILAICCVIFWVKCSLIQTEIQF